MTVMTTKVVLQPPARCFEYSATMATGRMTNEITPKMCDGMRTTKGKPNPEALVRMVVAR
jgi:hypothetical protein